MTLIFHLRYNNQDGEVKQTPEMLKFIRVDIQVFRNCY